MPAFSADELALAIAREHDDAVEILLDLVGEASVVGNEAGAQLIVEGTLRDLGFDVRRLDIPAAIADDPLAGVPSAPYEGRFDVVGTTPLDGGPTLLLNGHIDVVPVKRETWSLDPFAPEIRGGWLFGRGAGDMKGGFAMAFLALRALRRLSPRLIDHNLSFLSVIEEECTGNGTLAALRQGVSADVVLLPEPTDLSLLLGGIAITWVKVMINFGGGHAETSDRLASPADVASELVREIRRLEERYNRDPEPPFDAIKHPFNVNVGVIRLGEWPSSVPASLEFEVRVGHPADVTDEDVLGDLRQAVATALGAAGDAAFSVKSHGFRAQQYHLGLNSPLVRAMATTHRSLHGDTPDARVIGSTTDARFYRNVLDVPVLCYGPVVRNMHGSDESVELESIAKGAATLALFIATYLNEGGLDAFGADQ